MVECNVTRVPGQLLLTANEHGSWLVVILEWQSVDLAICSRVLSLVRMQLTTSCSVLRLLASHDMMMDGIQEEMTKFWRETLCIIGIVDNNLNRTS